MVSMRIPISFMVAISATLTSCNGSNPPNEVQRWSGLVSDLRFDWSSEDGIDIEGSPAVPVRAYIESSLLAQYAGNLEFAYPGFTEAVPPDAPPNSTDAGKRSLRPNTNHPLQHQLVGTNRYHLLAVDRNEQLQTVTICNYNYAVAAEKSKGAFTSVAQTGYGDTAGIYAMRITLTPPTETPALPPQAGPLPAPTEDVFNGWKVSSSSGALSAGNPGFNAVWPTNQADYASCVAKAPDSPEKRAFFTNGEHPRDDFPTAAPSPGWPERSS